MDILIVGGTRFLGRHIALSALARGHRVTAFHRGLFATSAVEGCENIIGDRKSDLHRLDRQWDITIDTCGYVPSDVLASAHHLRSIHCGAYLFVSTVNAFVEPIPHRMTEEHPRWSTGDMNATEMTLEQYGPLKAACESVVEAAFADKATVVRPGLIVGPNDPTDRFTYWVRRVAEGGDILVPGDPARNVQFIDVRDLAEWIIAMVEAGERGLFTAAGSARTMSELLGVCKLVSGSNAVFHWAPDNFLLERHVEPWSEMPLWVPGDEDIAFNSISSAKAEKAGLQYRKLTDTVDATMLWDRTRPADIPLKAGLSRKREAELLQEKIAS